MDTKKVILAISLAFFGAVLAYDAGLIGRHTASRGERADGKRQAPDTGLPDRKPSEYPGVIKDIFSPPVTAAATTGGRAPKAARPQPSISIPVASPLPPAPEPSALQTFTAQARFVGFLENSGNRTVFISKGQEIFTLKKGSVIEQRFSVEDISDKEIRLKESATGEETRIFISVHPGGK